MTYDPAIHHRKSIRLPEYDYSQQGLYYVTICTQHKENRLGKILNKEMLLNTAGEMVDSCWQDLVLQYPNITLDAYVIMPNHVHGIIVIDDVAFHSGRVGTTRATTRVAPTITLGDIVGTFKSITTNLYIQGVKKQQWPVFDKNLWQKNYYEHIIRNESSLEKIREYILENPYNWEKDEWFNTHPVSNHLV